MTIITRSTEQPVVDLDAWRARYHAQRRIERSRRESAISEAIASYCQHHGIGGRICAAAQAHASRLHRNGSSAAAAIAAGKRRASDLAWGEPEGAA